jgi:hypothetical protein
MRSRLSLAVVLCSAPLISASLGGETQAQELVGNPFVSSYTDWVDPAPARNGTWRLSLHNPTLMETSDLIPAGNNPPAATNNGSFVPALLIQDAFTTPAAYTLNARLYSSDDDGFGLVFGYQNVDNYFRITSRAQANGNLGGTNGLSVQKVVNGVATQINPNGIGAGFNVDNSFTLIDSRSPYDLTVTVDGNSYSVSMAGANGGSPIWTGSDPDLSAGKIGIHSWAQRNRTTAQPFWGTEAQTITVTGGAGPLFTESFGDRAVRFRPLAMANSAGVRTNQTTPPILGDDRGNFGLDVQGRWIYEQNNGFEWATETAPNVDFLGPAVVVDEPGSASLGDYIMKVRLGGRDNDGLGVLVRAQDDDNFYRVNFSTETMNATNAWERAPQGLSVQKVRNGVWTELFRDDQNAPLFIYANGPAGATNPANGLNMFDLMVKAEGNTLAIQVTDHLGNVIDYPLITDATDPLLTGTVGFTTWGDEHVYFTSYGGVPGPLVTAVPEPGALAAASLAIACLWRRRRAGH